MQFATPNVLRDAAEFLDSLEPGGGTNTHDALRSALQEPDVEEIYFLSDGEPSEGQTDAEFIVQDVRRFNAMRARPAIIHTVAFLMGHEYDDPTPRRLMGSIASVTGGVFRCLDPFAHEDEEHGDFMDDSSFSDNDEGFQKYYAGRVAAIPQGLYDMCGRASLLENMPPPPNWKGNLINRGRNPNEVTLPKVEAQKDHGHHIYDILVELRDVVSNKPVLSWTLSKTFNNFKHLDDKVRTLVDHASIHLPPDPLLHHHGPEFLENRRLLLQTYIQSLYTTLGPFVNDDLNEFLMYSTNVDEAIAEATDIYQAQYIYNVQNVAPPQGFIPPQGFVPPPQGFVPPPQGFVPPQSFVPPPQSFSPQVSPVPPPGYVPQIVPPAQVNPPPVSGFPPGNPPLGYVSPPPVSPEYVAPTPQNAANPTGPGPNN